MRDTNGAASGDGFTVAVMSFNRGKHLEHCVASIERHAPMADILVVDDLSDDPDTRAALERIGARWPVLTPERARIDNPKVGGLYVNMQLALDNLPDGRLLFYFQDDMQMVRDVTAADVRDMQRHFEANENAAFLCTMFMRGHHREREYAQFRWDAARGCYFRQDESGSPIGYFMAACTTRTDRLRAVDWRFANREKLNDRQAAEHFGPMGHVRDPVSMFLPGMPVFRGRRRSWALRRAERRMHAGFHPYHPLEGAVLDRLLERDEHELPIAEDWLETETGLPAKPWPWGPFRGARWLRNLDRIENEIVELAERARGRFAAVRRRS